MGGWKFVCFFCKTPKVSLGLKLMTFGLPKKSCLMYSFTSFYCTSSPWIHASTASHLYPCHSDQTLRQSEIEQPHCIWLVSNKYARNCIVPEDEQFPGEFIIFMQQLFMNTQCNQTLNVKLWEYQIQLQQKDCNIVVN